MRITAFRDGHLDLLPNNNIFSGYIFGFPIGSLTVHASRVEWGGYANNHVRCGEFVVEISLDGDYVRYLSSPYLCDGGYNPQRQFHI